MSAYSEVRWMQRFEHFEKALGQLHGAVQRYEQDEFDIVIRAGVIQMYEFTFELGWKTIKDYLKEQGIEVSFPAEVIRSAFQAGIVRDAELWLEGLKDRNRTSHIYDEETALVIAKNITGTYMKILDECSTFFKKLCEPA